MGKVTVRQVFEEWEDWMKFSGLTPSTRERNKEVVNQWVRDNEFWDRDPNDMDRRVLDSCINAPNKWALSTRTRRFAALRSFCKFANGEGYLRKNPTILMKVRVKELTFEQKEPKKRLPFTHEEFENIMQFLERGNPKWTTRERFRRAELLRFGKVFFMMGYWTGLRASDICMLERACFTGKGLIVWTNKRDRRVEIPLDKPYTGNGVVIDLLNSWAGEGPYFFPKLKRLYSGYRIDSSRFYRSVIMRWIRQAGISDKCFHCTRHSFVTRLHEQGLSLESIGKIVGHVSAQTTSGYCHPEIKILPKSKPLTPREMLIQEMENELWKIK